MSASKRKWRIRWWMWLVVAFVCMRYGSLVMPRVSVHYAEDAPKELRFVWEDNRRTYDSAIYPGGYTIELLDIVRDEDYYVEFIWWQPNGGRTHCVSVTPKWPNTVIYLDKNADIDYSKDTDADRLHRCAYMSADM
ncbi:hypothetical protein [Pseudomonas marincola]|nr:hypothetical protein [Pseudomonas marincola]